MKKSSFKRRKIRHRKIKAKIFGTKKLPRLSVFRSSKHTYGQLIDDHNFQTLAFFSTVNLDKESSKLTKTEKARLVGEKLGKVALEKGLKNLVADRGGFRYHGRVKALINGTRNQGIKI